MWIKKKKQTKEKINSEKTRKIIMFARKEMLKDFYLSQTLMQIAENKLIESFDENQQALYENFHKMREKFFACASKIYYKIFSIDDIKQDDK